MDANKTHREKARWELHKNAMYNSEQILEATPHKTAAVQPLTSHFKNYTRHVWRSENKFISDILLWTPTHGHARIDRPARTYLQQL